MGKRDCLGEAEEELAITLRELVNTVVRMQLSELV
jgi:hypothetical protein